MAIIWVIGSAVFALLMGLYLHSRLSRGICQSLADLTGKTVIVTGANTGIGFATAVDLAKRNARIILACRRMDAGEKAAQAIRQNTHNNNVLVKHLDLASMKSVRKFAEEINKEEPQLNILINNAGMAYAAPNAKTEDGLDCLMATNYFGPFLLTNLLLDLIKKSSPSRVVNVSSMAHRWGKVDFDNLNCEKYYPEYTIYGTTKLCNILFSCELSRRLQGTGVTSNSLHPGTVASDLFQKIPKPFNVIVGAIAPLFFKNIKEGAQTSLHCAVSERLEGVSGKYFSDCKETPKAKSAQDDKLAEALWEASVKITGLTS